MSRDTGDIGDQEGSAEAYTIKRNHKTIDIFAEEGFGKEMAPAYKITYFNVMALAEPIRMLLTYGGIEFEDNRFEREDWPKLKPHMPFGQVPVMEVGGKTYHQSIAMARCIARKVKLVGDDEFQDLEIDAAVDTINDMRMRIAKWSYEQNEEYKASIKDALFNEQIPFYLDRLDKQVAANKGYFALGKLTWADVFFLGVLDYMNFMAGMDLTANHKNLKEVRDNVLKVPSIKAWVDKRPKTDM